MKLNFCPTHIHTMGSLLDGICKPSEVVSRCLELGYNSCTITDHRNISLTVQFFKECQKKIKPILGCELDITYDLKQRETDHLVVLAKNHTGWKNLIKTVTRSNDDDLYYYKARVPLEEISSEGLIAFSGHPGSSIFKCIFDKEVYNLKSKEKIYGCIRPSVEQDLKQIVQQHQKIFKDFYFEIQLFDQNPLQEVLAEILRDQSKILGVECVACIDAHYIRKEDADDQRVLLCSSLKTTLSKVKEQLKSGEFGLSGFFESSNYYIHSLNEMLEYHKGYEHEIENSQKIADGCDEYDILSKPKLPNFGVADDFEHLKELCREGWRNKINGVISEEKKKEYELRIKYELQVIKEANLSGYFLIVQDYCNWYTQHGWLLGVGRGSAAGCLISYLLGITGVDPIQYNLLFERFFNIGRKESLGDIDIDFQPEHREKVIEYVSNKYGKNKVAQITTFGRLMGRSALKEVLRIHEACSFSEINKITVGVPDEAKIADELEDMDEKSIILWALINRADRFNDYCIYKDGKFSGPYAKYFEQAIRLEGTLKSQGKHAAGVIISSDDISEVCPLVRDKSDNKIVGFEMGDAEAVGLVKFDILGLSVLSKLVKINELSNTS